MYHGRVNNKEGKPMKTKLETFDEWSRRRTASDDFTKYANNGPLQDRYNIYVEFSGEDFPKTFDEWLNS